MKNDWEKKATCSAYLSSKIFATSAWVWMRSTSFSLFQWSNWSPTYILHLFQLEDAALLFQGRIQGGLKLEKIWLFGVKSWFFTRNTPTICLSPPPNLTSWIRPCIPLSLWIRQSPLSSTRWHFLFCPRTTCCLLFLNCAHAQDELT